MKCWESSETRFAQDWGLCELFSGVNVRSKFSSSFFFLFFGHRRYLSSLAINYGCGTTFNICHWKLNCDGNGMSRFLDYAVFRSTTPWRHHGVQTSNACLPPENSTNFDDFRHNWSSWRSLQSERHFDFLVFRNGAPRRRFRNCRVASRNRGRGRGRAEAVAFSLKTWTCR